MCLFLMYLKFWNNIDSWVPIVLCHKKCIIFTYIIFANKHPIKCKPIANLVSYSKSAQKLSTLSTFWPFLLALYYVLRTDKIRHLILRYNWVLFLWLTWKITFPTQSLKSQMSNVLCFYTTLFKKYQRFVIWFFNFV